MSSLERTWNAEDVLNGCLNGTMPDIVRHSKRVRELCESIIKELPEEFKQGIDQQLVYDAAILHDVGKPREKVTGEDHNEIAQELLKARGLDDEKLFEVIRVHKERFDPRFADQEAMILRMADKIDKLNKVKEKFANEKKGADKLKKKYQNAEEKYEKELGKVKSYFTAAGRQEVFQTIACACNIVFEAVRQRI